MTDVTVGSITQLTHDTAGRHWTWHAPLTEDVVTFGTLPDPRDARIAELEAQDAEARARIAELEAAMRVVRRIAVDQRLPQIFIMASSALVPPPEGDMRITVMELPA